MSADLVERLRGVVAMGPQQQAVVEEAAAALEAALADLREYADNTQRLQGEVVELAEREERLRRSLEAFCEYQEAARHPWPALDQLVKQGREALASGSAEERDA